MNRNYRIIKLHIDGRWQYTVQKRRWFIFYCWDNFIADDGQMLLFDNYDNAKEFINTRRTSEHKHETFKDNWPKDEFELAQNTNK